jgi:hypothetical protein
LLCTRVCEQKLRQLVRLVSSFVGSKGWLYASSLREECDLCINVLDESVLYDDV